MTAQLFLVNVPYNCTERELKEWIESYGIETVSIRIIRDLVAAVSPAFAYAVLKNGLEIERAVHVLNGKKIRNQFITVRKASWQRVPVGG